MFRTMNTRTFLLLLAVVCSVSSSFAGTAVEYMNRISEKQQAITSESMGYISAVAHGKSARKVSKQRSELINALVSARAMAKNMGAFEGDTLLRAAAYAYFDLSYIVFKEDYGKIMDLEEIAEQSYDNMEAYLTAQDVANDKLDKANEKVQAEYKAFAQRHGVQLIEEETKMSKMAEQVNKVNKYYHDIFLLFFKSYRTELFMVEAMSKRDVNGVEQNKNTLTKSTDESLAKLAKATGFEGDVTVINACRALLQFYQNEAKTKMQPITDYLVQEETFEKIKKATESNSNRSQADVDAYNKAANELNKLGAAYNKTNKELNDSRSRLLNDWNNALETFFSKHTPRYNK